MKVYRSRHFVSGTKFASTYLANGIPPLPLSALVKVCRESKLHSKSHITWTYCVKTTTNVRVHFLTHQTRPSIGANPYRQNARAESHVKKYGMANLCFKHTVPT